jgi:hypothetical protein
MGVVGTQSPQKIISNYSLETTLLATKCFWTYLLVDMCFQNQLDIPCGIFIPIQSPRLNPIEQFFNQMKFYMKLTKAMTIQALKDSVKEAIDKVRPENYQNYFAYAYDRKQLTRLDKGVSTKHRPLKIYKD